MMEEYEVAIIGCGPAGLSAGIYCGRAQLKTGVKGIPEKSQGQLAKHIENYFGFPEGVDGGVLISKGIIHCTKFGVKFVKEEVVSATEVGDSAKKFIIKTSSTELSAKSMIIATGTPIRMSVTNEEKLIGKGVHYCVSCDGPMYKNKKIAIIGNGNHAAEDAIEALSYTKDVVIIANSTKFDFSDAYDKELTKWQIRTVLGKVREFHTEKWLESLVMEDGTELKFDGVFMACGSAGALDFAANLGLELKDNILVVDESGMTSIPGVFAAGNCAGRCRQIAKNVGDGCNAGTSVIRYLRSKDAYMDYGHRDDTTIAKNEIVPAAVQIPAPHKKLRIGWFSFSCCEDSTIVFTEMLNDYYDKLKDLVDIAHARVLKSKNDMTDLDIAFVEGAISNDRMAEELKKIRANSKKLVAIGACAVSGMPSGQRNEFDEERKREIEPIVRTFDYSKDVRSLNKIVTVDDNVPGCPMSEAGFLAVLNRQIKEFGIDAQL